MERLEKPSQFWHPAIPNQYIMQGSILSVHVIDARDLKTNSGAVASARVRLSIEKTRSNT